MTKKILSLVLVLVLALSAVAALAESVKINAKNFPDSTFRKVIKKVCDTNKDGKLSDKEIKAVKSLDLYFDTVHYDLGISGTIKDLTGIERFTNLQDLDFHYQNVKKLDVSKNTKLRSLCGDWNEALKTVKLGKQKYLDYLLLNHTKLKKVDISGCPKLLKLLNQYDGEGGFGRVKGGPGIAVSCKLYNGKKLAVRTRKPTSIAFKKSKVSVTRKQLNSHLEYDLGIYVVLEPAGTMYPIRYSSSNSDFVECDEDGSSFWINPEAKKGSTATLTAKCGKKTAKIKITLK